MPEFQLPAGLDLFDWFVLALRIAFIALIYLFLYQVGRTSVRELVTIGKISASSPTERPIVQSVAMLEVVAPGESSWQQGTQFPLDYFTTLGRNPENSIVLNDSFVSGTHAEVSLQQSQWWLADLGSTNGTRLNGQQIAGRVPLQSGDVISIGGVQLRALM